MEIAVQEFSGYSSFDNNHIYDLVVSLRIMKTVTDVRTPDVVVLAGVTHMLERALVLQGLALVGHPSAAAFEVIVSHVGGLIDITREESQGIIDELKLELALAADKESVLKREFEANMGGLRSARDSIQDLRYKNRKLQDQVTELEIELSTPATQ